PGRRTMQRCMGCRPATASIGPPTHGSSSPSPVTQNGAGASRSWASRTWPTIRVSTLPRPGATTTQRSLPWFRLPTQTISAWEQRFIQASLAGVRADAATPGQFFSHDPQVLANDFTPECNHPRFGTHRRWGPIVRVNGGLDSYGPGVLAGQQTDRLL